MRVFCLETLALYFLLSTNLVECHVIRKRSDVRIVTPPSQVPALPPGWTAGCYHDGSWYPLNSEVSKTRGDGWCSGLYCESSGDLLAWASLNCGDTTPAVPTTPTTMTPTTATSAPVTTDFPTTVPIGCEMDGKWYAPGSDIGSGSDGHGWCYGTYCSDDGHVITWDNFNCDPTTMPPTTAPPTTMPPTTMPPPDTVVTTPMGCEVDGKWYAPGSDIDSGSDGHGWCYGTYCSDDSNIIPWDNFKCDPTTMPPTTVPPTTMPPTTVPPPDTDGQITSRVNFKSQPNEETTMPPPATTPPVTPPLGCEYEGKVYAPNSDIHRGSDGKGWCGGTFCDDHGNVVNWDDFNCHTTDNTTPLPTTPQTTPEPKTATNVETEPGIQATMADATQKDGCVHFGKWYPLNSQISMTKIWQFCAGFLCNGKGEVEPKVCRKCGDNLANCLSI